MSVRFFHLSYLGFQCLRYILAKPINIFTGIYMDVLHASSARKFCTHWNDHWRDSRRILCCGVGSPLKNPFSVGREQIMDKYFMYKCMESRNRSCNVSRIIASMSGRVDETPHRNDESNILSTIYLHTNGQLLLS